MTTHTLIYVHDPMCSWCWAFAPTWAEIQRTLAGRVAVVSLVGGLAPDTDEPMPQEMRGFLSDTWRRIEARVPGTRFNHDFWRLCQPRRATWPACRAVLAAEHLRPGAGAEMIAAIQRAYYLEARNPSDREVLLALGGEIGLPAEAFAAELDSDANRRRHQQQMARAQSLGVDSYPTLLLQGEGALQRLPLDYNRAATLVAAVESILPAR